MHALGTHGCETPEKRAKTIQRDAAEREELEAARARAEERKAQPQKPAAPPAETSEQKELKRLRRELAALKKKQADPAPVRRAIKRRRKGVAS